MQYATGSYIFTGRTHTFSFNHGLALQGARARLTVGIPVVVQNSGAVSGVGRWLLPTGGPDHTAVRRRDGGRRVPMGGRWQRADAPAGDVSDSTGTAAVVAGPGDYRAHLGDPVLGAAVEVYRGWGAVRSVEVNGFAKLPLAGVESGIGTGEWDVAGGTSIALAAGRALVFGDVAYWSYGDLPDLELRDGLSYGLGLGFPLGDRLSLLASFSAADAIIEGVDAYAALALAGSYAVGAASGLNLGIGAGLTEAAPDLSVFLGWRVGLGGRGRVALPAASGAAMPARVATRP